MENDIKQAAELIRHHARRWVAPDSTIYDDEYLALAHRLDALAAQEPVTHEHTWRPRWQKSWLECAGCGAKTSCAAPLGPINAHAGKEAEENGAVVDPFLPNAHASTAAFKAAPSQEGVGQGEHGHPAKKLVNGFRNAFRDAGSILGLAAADAHAAQPAEPKQLTVAQRDAVERVLHDVHYGPVVNVGHDAEAGISALIGRCKTCRGTGADPASDNVNWLPCPTCHGRGPVAAPPEQLEQVAWMKRAAQLLRWGTFNDETMRECNDLADKLDALAAPPADAHAIPREPTDKMLVCGWWKYVGNSNDVHGTCAAIWRAMYDAAPHKAKD